MAFARPEGMRGFLQDLRQALRRLVAAPGFTVVAIVALALGIGANTAIFTVVDAALLRPLPYAAADRLVVVEGLSKSDSRASAVTGADFLDLRGLGSVAGVAAMRGHGMNLAGEHPERISGAVVSSNFFDVLGARLLAGRGFGVGDGGTPREAVLGEGLWRARFGADPAIVGQTLTVNGEPFAIVGVASAEVQLPSGSELWVTPRWKVPDHPLRPQNDNSADRDSAYLDVVARLKSGATPVTLQAEATALGKRLERDFPSNNQGRGFRVTPLRESLYGNLRPTLLLLGAAVAFILLIACANVANLLLARAVSRQHEVAVRQALGAPRWRLVRLFLAESLLLAASGAALGLVLSLWAAPPLAALSPAYVRPESLRLDGRILAFTAGLALATAFAFGMIPALQGAAPAEALRDAGRAGTSGRKRSRLRSALIVAEVALALILLIGAGLMLRSFERLSSVNPGFDPSSTTAADVWLPQSKYPDSPRQVAFYLNLVRALTHAPGVTAAAAVSRLPLSGGNSSRDVSFPDAPDKMLLADYRIATAGYFETMRIPLRAGHVFTAGEVESGARIAVVNEAFARAAWEGQGPLGRAVLVTTDGKPVEIVGVVGDVKHISLAVPPRPEIYLPLSLEAWPFMTLVVRGHGDLSALLRTETTALDPDQPLYRVGTVESRLASSLGPRRFGAYLLGLLAVVALVLAITGIYGVLSYSVAQRTREMGIRLALGATPRAVLGLVVGDAFRLVGAGVAIGIGAALGLTQLLRSLLFGVSATDPATYAALAVLLCGVALVASLVAGRRATSVDPALALRAE
jgi:putative ABC transport system permease protein